MSQDSTNGANNSLSASVSIPPGDYKYFNVNVDHKSYRPLNDSVTLKLTGNINLSKGYSDEELPFYKRHFGGGSGSVRGFGNKTLGPLYPNGKAKGGEISILGSANLITPAFFFDNNEKMRMSAFIDAGNIFEKSSSIKLGDIRMSTGLGFAYLSPIGSIGAFISTPIIKKDALKMELTNFVNSIKGLEKPIVDGKAGRNALELAIKIQDKILEGYRPCAGFNSTAQINAIIKRCHMSIYKLVYGFPQFEYSKARLR